MKKVENSFSRANKTQTNCLQYFMSSADAGDCFGGCKWYSLWWSQGLTSFRFTFKWTQVNPFLVQILLENLQTQRVDPINKKNLKGKRTPSTTPASQNNSIEIFFFRIFLMQMGSISFSHSIHKNLRHFDWSNRRVRFMYFLFYDLINLMLPFMSFQ